MGQTRQVFSLFCPSRLPPRPVRLSRLSVITNWFAKSHKQRPPCPSRSATASKWCKFGGGGSSKTDRDMNKVCMYTKCYIQSLTPYVLVTMLLQRMLIDCCCCCSCQMFKCSKYQSARNTMLDTINDIHISSKNRSRFDISENVLLAPTWDSRVSRKDDRIIKAALFDFICTSDRKP